MTRFNSIDKTVNKLCVPIHGGKYWSVLDVIILPETGCMHGYVKETDYMKQPNNEVIVDSIINKVIIFPMWQVIFSGLYTKEKNCI